MLVECSRKKQVVVSLLNGHTLFFFFFDVAYLTAFLSALIISYRRANVSTMYGKCGYVIGNT